MRYASIRKMDISNGEGLGVALFVQGCHFHCKNCFNQMTWDFKYGKEFTIILLDNMYEILGQNGNNFNRYQNSFNVYFLPDNREVFTIMTKLNNKKKPTSLDFEKDSGLIEKYRIIIKD